MDSRPNTALVAKSKVLSPRKSAKDETDKKVNVFKVMHNVARFKMNLKDKLADNQHAKILSKAPIIKKRGGIQKKNKDKVWTMKKLRQELYAIKGKLPYLQKYKKSQ